MAINSTISDQNVKYLEARITPVDSTYDLCKLIERVDLAIEDRRFKKQTEELFVFDERKYCYKNSYKNYHYILHFIKRTSSREKNSSKYTNEINPRNWGLRKDVKEQTLAINEVRKSSSKSKERIIGIDAASSEIGYRPELFAQSYRYLKKYSYQVKDEFLQGSSFKQLGFTYHVGEDYLDIVDGLRAIEEAILFLNLDRGDRIGHALALGLDAQEYYKLKHKTMVMPKQDFLDNLAWLLAKIRIYNINISQNLVYKLTEWFYRYYSEIFDNVIKDSVNPDIYYSSWLLRGDDPYLYFEYNTDREFLSPPPNFWNSCSLNYFSEEMNVARKNKIAIKLYKEYHFNSLVKQNGKICDEYIIFNDYIHLVSEIQKAMRFDIAKRHICIETNPTSNQVIGSYKRYAKHPIVSFYNLGLTNNSSELDQCPQLSVSLNTDDQGVFSTYLENEYALMAIALEKEIGKNGKQRYNQRMIYEWLDKIRAMGFEQRFLKND